MAETLPTLDVKHPEHAGEAMRINARDFDAARHELLTAEAPTPIVVPTAAPSAPMIDRNHDGKPDRPKGTPRPPRPAPQP